MARSINRETYAATIAAGDSLSPAIAVGGLVPVGIVMPAAWTAAVLTFLVSVDDQNFYPLQDMSGEVTAGAAAGQYIALDPAIFIGIVSLKLRSGTASAPVAQPVDAPLTLVAKI